MHYGSSEEEARSEEEAGAQDRGSEEADGEEDRYRTAEEGYEEKVAGEARGRWLPRLPLSPVRPGACRGAFPQAFSISFTLAARPLRAARCHRRVASSRGYVPNSSSPPAALKPSLAISAQSSPRAEASRPSYTLRSTT